MEDKAYNVDMSYPSVAALLRREYAGMDCMGQILEKCTSVIPQGVMQQFERLLKDTEKSCGTLEVNGKCVGTVANIGFEVDKERCDGLKEFVKMMQDEASERRVRPLQCPFDNTRGCLNGDIWIIEHNRVEDGYKTHECRIRGHRCAAWSDEYGRCVRLYPVLEHERVEKLRSLARELDKVVDSTHTAMNERR